YFIGVALSLTTLFRFSICFTPSSFNHFSTASKPPSVYASAAPAQVALPHNTPLNLEPEFLAKLSDALNMSGETPALKKINGTFAKSDCFLKYFSASFFEYTGLSEKPSTNSIFTGTSNLNTSTPYFSFPYSSSVSNIFCGFNFAYSLDLTSSIFRSYVRISKKNGKSSPLHSEPTL